jgi:integrase
LLNTMVDVFGNYALSAISPSLLSEYRDARIKIVSPQTVKHELGMISRIFQAALLDWKIELPKGNPVSLIRKPAVDNDRDRRLEGDEEKLLLDSLQTGCTTQWPYAITVLAIETGARQGELLSMKWEEVFLDKRTVRIRGIDGGTTKNGDPYRDIPLTKRATELLRSLPQAPKGKVFPITRDALKKSWERAVERGRKEHVHSVLLPLLEKKGFDKVAQKGELNALIYKKRKSSPITVKLLEQINREDKVLVNLHFHDLRHEGTSRLADKLAMHELMKVTGHKTTRMLARYYHPRAEELSKKLDD